MTPEEILARGIQRKHFGPREYVGGWLIEQVPEEICAFLALAKREIGDVHTYLEIGLACGGTFRLVAEELEPVVMLGIDSDKRPEDRKTRAEAIGSIEGKGIDIRTHWGDSTSPKAATWLQLQPYVDIAFVDGGHDYHTVRRDTLMVCERMTGGGLVAFHDSLVKKSNCEVWRWCERLDAGNIPALVPVAKIGEKLGIAVYRWEPEMPYRKESVN